MRAPRSVAALLVAVSVMPATACTADTKPKPPVETSPSPGATNSPVQTATATVTTAARRLTVRILSGTVDPAPGRFEVREGDPVLIEITSDVADTVHVHGYDIETKVEPGETARLEFVADRQGLWDVETHETHLTLFQLEVR